MERVVGASEEDEFAGRVKVERGVVQVGGFEELFGCVSVEVGEECINALSAEEGALTLVGRYVATTSLTLAVAPACPFSAPMSPIGVMLKDRR